METRVGNITVTFSKEDEFEINLPNSVRITVGNGTVKWYENKKLHLIGGPAIKWSDVSEEWYENGKLHRTGGPATKYADGTEGYWLNGNKVDKEEVMGKIIEADGKKYRLVEVVT